MTLRLLILALIVLISISCKENEKLEVPETRSLPVQNTIKNKDIYELERFAKSFQPTKIDFSNNAELNKFDLQRIYGKEFEAQDSLRNEIANILLLKQYLFHLSTCNQGYDLLSMRKEQARYIIDYFIATHDLPRLEMLNSGYPYTLLETAKNRSGETDILCRKIEIESKRIRAEDF